MNEKELAAQLAALRAELDSEKAKREEAERKLTSATTNRKNRLTRPFVAGLILRALPELSVEDFIETTDKYFADNGGKSNKNEAGAVARLARKVLDGFNADPKTFPEIPGTEPSVEPTTAPAKEAPVKK